MDDIEQMIAESKNKIVSKQKEAILVEICEATNIIDKILVKEVKSKNQITFNNLTILVEALHIINSNLFAIGVQKYGDENNFTNAIGNANCDISEAVGYLKSMENN